jgi:hypothetical protein
VFHRGLIRFPRLLVIMSVGPSASDGATAADRSSTRPASARPRAKSRALLVIIAVAVVVVLLASLFALGVFSGGSSSSAGPMSFGTARSVANATADAHGTWLLISAEGFDSAIQATAPFNPGNFPAGCNISSFTGPIPTNISWPGYHGNLSSGLATEWWFYYYQPTIPAVFEVAETNGAVSVAFEASGAACLRGVEQVGQPINDSVVDSSVAVASALAAGGAGFLKNHTGGVSLTLYIAGGGYGWFVGWATCSLFPDSYGWIGSGSMYDARVNATNGSVVPGSTFSGKCGGPPPIEAGIGFGTPTLALESNPGTLATQGCTMGDYCYTVPITRVAFNVTPGNLSLGVFENHSGDESVVGFAILNSAGQVVVSSSGPGTGAGGGLWSPGVGTSATLLDTAMQLTIDMGPQDPQGQGYVLSTEGWGSGFELSPYFSISLP